MKRGYLFPGVTWYQHADTNEIVSDEIYWERSREQSMDDWYEVEIDEEGYHVVNDDTPKENITCK